MSITLEQAKNLTYGTTLYHVSNRNADGTPQRWKVNGKPQTWKTRPNEVRVPVKNGLRNYDQLWHWDLDLVSLDEAELINQDKESKEFWDSI
jgi:hypothetical protein